MQTKERKRRVPSVLEASIYLVLVIAVVVAGIRLGIGSQMSLFLGAVVAMVTGLLLGVPWNEIQESMLKVINNSMVAILILLIVGIMIGAWIIGGTVPSLMYFGLKIVSPSIILPLTFVLCAVMSVFTGTSFGSIATMGLALTGVAMGMGIPVPMVVGAVISGAYFGDKLSPMSDNTNMGSAMAGTSLFEHIGSMMYTTLPAMLITLVLYVILGLRYASGAMDTTNIDLMMTTLDNTFSISIIAIIPAAMMLVVSVPKIPAILGLSGCAVFSLIFAMLLQNVSPLAVLKAGFSGYVSETGVALVDTILTRGGINAMMGTVALVIIASLMGGALQASGVLSVVVEDGLMKMIKNRTALVVITMVYSYFILLISGNQVLGLVMVGPTMQSAYDDLDLDRKVLSRAMADTTTVAAPLVPWSTACAYTMGVLGVTAAYVPYAFLCYTVPIFTIICAVTGFGMWHKDGTPYWKKKTVSQ